MELPPLSPPNCQRPHQSQPPGGTRDAQISQSGRARAQSLRTERGSIHPKLWRGRGRARSTTHAPSRTRSPTALAPLPTPARRGRGCGRPPRVRRPRRGGGASERPAGRGLLSALLWRGPLAPPPNSSRPRAVRSCELSQRPAWGRRRSPAAAAAALCASSGRPRPRSHPPRAHLPAVPRARRSEEPAASAAAAASLRGESSRARAAADRRTVTGCARRPRGPAAPFRGADPPRASGRGEVLWRSRAALVAPAGPPRRPRGRGA